MHHTRPPTRGRQTADDPRWAAARRERPLPVRRPTACARPLLFGRAGGRRGGPGRPARTAEPVARRRLRSPSEFHMLTRHDTTERPRTWLRSGVVGEPVQACTQQPLPLLHFTLLARATPTRRGRVGMQPHDDDHHHDDQEGGKTAERAYWCASLACGAAG